MQRQRKRRTSLSKHSQHFLPILRSRSVSTSSLPTSFNQMQTTPFLNPSKNSQPWRQPLTAHNSKPSGTNSTTTIYILITRLMCTDSRILFVPELPELLHSV